MSSSTISLPSSPPPSQKAKTHHLRGRRLTGLHRLGPLPRKRQSSPQPLPCFPLAHAPSCAPPSGNAIPAQHGILREPSTTKSRQPKRHFQSPSHQLIVPLMSLRPTLKNLNPYLPWLLNIRGQWTFLPSQNESTVQQPSSPPAHTFHRSIPPSQTLRDRKSVSIIVNLSLYHLWLTKIAKKELKQNSFFVSISDVKTWIANKQIEDRTDDITFQLFDYKSNAKRWIRN